MKAREIRDLSLEEIRQKADELEKEYFELRKVKATGKLENPLQLRRVRRNLARVRTVLNATK
ncbi:MAG: 50S ribosomal protein L29 [Kiritimatiellia bacterium]|jgi:large subunit ribosomal protein L29